MKSQQNQWVRPAMSWGVLAATLVLWGAQTANAQPWRYEDRKGVHYTSNPLDLPPAQRQKVLADIEEKRKARAEAAAKAAEEAAKNPAPLAAPSGGLAVPPPVPQPVVLENSKTTPAAPASAAPTPREVWQRDVKAAETAADAAKADAEAAEVAAQKASQRALITPSGQHFAAYEEAKKAADEKRAAVEQARQAVEKLKVEQPQ